MIGNLLQKSVITVLLIFGLCACSSGPGSSTPTQPTAKFEAPHKLLLEDESPNFNVPIAEADAFGRIEHLRVKHQMVECEGFQVSHCLVVQKEGSDEWTYFYDRIEGFNYQWGHNYEILVQVLPVDHGLADTSGQRYLLLEVVSETLHDSDEAFNYISHLSHERIEEVAPGTFSLLGGKEFLCTEQSCDALHAAILQQQSMVLLFQHHAVPSEPLILAAVVCGDSASSFTTSCL